MITDLLYFKSRRINPGASARTRILGFPAAQLHDSLSGRRSMDCHGCLVNGRFFQVFVGHKDSRALHQHCCPPHPPHKHPRERIFFLTLEKARVAQKKNGFLGRFVTVCFRLSRLTLFLRDPRAGTSGREWRSSPASTSACDQA